jgi:hypothetical protein
VDLVRGLPSETPAKSHSFVTIHKKNRLLSRLRHYPRAALDYSREPWISKVHKLLNKERNHTMRSLNLSMTNISNSLSQFMKGNDFMNHNRVFRALVLASLIATVGGLANAQSNGRWVGRIPISPSTSASASSSISSVPGTASADETTGVSPSATKPTIVGTWLLTVNVPDNAPPFDSFKALWSLTGDGLLICSAQGDVTPAPFPTASSAYGGWIQSGRRQYAATFVAILYDLQTGENLGTLQVNQSINLSDSNAEWNGPFQAKVSDSDGNLIVTLNGSVSAKRITVETVQ